MSPVHVLQIIYYRGVRACMLHITSKLNFACGHKLPDCDAVFTAVLQVSMPCGTADSNAERHCYQETIRSALALDESLANK
jgi:hypothetical protein